MGLKEAERGLDEDLKPKEPLANTSTRDKGSEGLKDNKESDQSKQRSGSSFGVTGDAKGSFENIDEKGNTVGPFSASSSSDGPSLAGSLTDGPSSSSSLSGGLVIAGSS